MKPVSEERLAEIKVKSDAAIEAINEYLDMMPDNMPLRMSCGIGLLHVIADEEHGLEAVRQGLSIYVSGALNEPIDFVPVKPPMKPAGASVH